MLKVVADSSCLRSTKNSVTLVDDELIYCLKYALDHLTPVTKAFSSTALRFGKDEKWCEKVIRYQSFRCQFESVIIALETENYPPLKLIKKYNQLNEKKLFKFNEWRGLINFLKDTLKLAQLLEDKELEITRLEKLFAKQRMTNHDLQAVRKSSLLYLKLNQYTPYVRSFLE